MRRDEVGGGLWLHRPNRVRRVLVLSESGQVSGDWLDAARA